MITIRDRLAEVSDALTRVRGARRQVEAFEKSPGAPGRARANVAPVKVKLSSLGTVSSTINPRLMRAGVKVTF